MLKQILVISKGESIRTKKLKVYNFLIDIILEYEIDLE